MNPCLVAVFVVLSLVAHGSGLRIKCHSCASNTWMGDDYCHDPYNGSGVVSECDEGHMCEYGYAHVDPTGEGQFHTFTYRTCTHGMENNNYRGTNCITRNYDNGSFDKTCFCATDFCNGGNMTALFL